MAVLTAIVLMYSQIQCSLSCSEHAHADESQLVFVNNARSRQRKYFRLPAEIQPLYFFHGYFLRPKPVEKDNKINWNCIEYEMT